METMKLIIQNKLYNLIDEGYVSEEEVRFSYTLKGYFMLLKLAEARAKDLDFIRIKKPPYELSQLYIFLIILMWFNFASKRANERLP